MAIPSELLRIPASRRERAEPVADDRRTPRFIQRDPVPDPVAESLEADSGITGERLRRLPRKPAVGDELIDDRQIPVVERRIRLNAVLEQRIDQIAVKGDAGRIGRSDAVRNDPRPCDRETVAGDAELRHELDVLPVTVIVVAGDVGGVAVQDFAGRARVDIPGREPAAHITTADSLVASSRIVGAEPDPARTLFYADDRTAVTLAGDTRLHGTLRLPQNGLTYGRVGAEFYRGEEVPRTAIRSSAAMLPAPSAAVAARIGALFAFAQQLPAAGDLPDSLGISFRDPTVALRLGTAEIGGCTLRGRIVLAANELRIDSACRLGNVLVCARKITVGSGARIAAQLFARDTVVVEPCAVLEYPSGIYAGRYAELGDRATADGYVIVRDTVRHKKMAASYRQSRTARVRGLLHADGAAQVQGIVAGCAELRQAVYFSPQGYYKDMLYDLTLLENSATAQPLWHGGAEAVRRKEAVCVE